MADYIPLVLQIKILCRLPVKSLIRFRSVSKEWLSLIDSCEFNSDYIIGQAKRRRLLLNVHEGDVDDDSERGEYCLLVDDDDSFPQHKISLTHPLSVNRLKILKQYSKFVGCSHGLLCFTGYYLGEDDDCFNCYVIWNPSIRKSLVINVPYNTGTVYVGFGFYPNSLDAKIVRIDMYTAPRDYESKVWLKLWRVEVFTLSTGVWRSPLTRFVPSKWFNIKLWSRTPFVLNGFIYWCAEVGNSLEKKCTYTIVSFDLASEDFTKIDVPDELAHDNFDMFKLRGSLGVVQREKLDSKEEVHKVWLMDHVSKSFIELEHLTVTLPEKWKVVGFRDNEQLIIVKIDEQRPELVAYEPYSKQFNNLGFYVDCSYVNSSYTESLLLLNQSDTLDDDEGDACVTGSDDQLKI